MARHGMDRHAGQVLYLAGVFILELKRRVEVDFIRAAQDSLD